MEDMIKIKLAVEGMQAEIIKVFDASEIADGIRQATEKAVKEFDLENFVANTIERVLECAREKAIEDLSAKYGGKWSDMIEQLIDEKIEQALKGTG